MNRFLSQILRVSACVVLCAAEVFAVEIEAEGKVSADSPAARTHALSAALQEAVRARADVIFNECGENKEVQTDNTFCKAMSYIKRYEVLSAGVTEDSLYTVKIKADVSDTPLNSSESLTFQMLAKEYESPRIAIQIDEQIEGVKKGTLASDWLSNTAVQCGLHVVDLDNAQGQNGMLVKRTEALGRKTEESIRSQGVVSACDYVIEGKIIGSASGEQSFYGSKPGKKYSIAFDVKVRDAATGNVLLALNSPAQNVLVRNVASDTVAAREAVRQLLEGNTRLPDTDYGWQLVRRIFTHWTSEKMLGATIKMEFVGLDLISSEKLQSELKKHKAVGAVWIRSIDAAAISVVDCETLVNSTELAKVVTSILPGFGLERSEKRYLMFRKGYIAKIKEDYTEITIVQDSSVPFNYWDIFTGLIVTGVGAGCGKCWRVYRRRRSL